ncbi:MAG: hypothetical protein G01um1014106_651 [Parcubacteria group bacterium Gr01-1014_106]|nr:MAG: hypothetical protein G01um1014106_651 [Parcubacteria group bacterium Gr01-1014_106]
MLKALRSKYPRSLLIGTLTLLVLLFIGGILWVKNSGLIIAKLLDTHQENFSDIRLQQPSASTGKELPGETILMETQRIPVGIEFDPVHERVAVWRLSNGAGGIPKYSIFLGSQGIAERELNRSGTDLVGRGFFDFQGRFIYELAPDGQRCSQTINIDGQEVGKGYGLRMSPNKRHFAYYVCEGLYKWFVVVDGQASSKKYSFSGGWSDIVFSPDGTKHAYTAKSSKGWFLVINETEGPAYSMISGGPPVFSEDGQLLAYVASDHSSSAFAVVRNLKTGEERRYKNLPLVPYYPSGLAFTGTDGDAIAFIAQVGDRRLLTINGKVTSDLPYKADEDEAATFRLLAISKDGKRFAYNKSGFHYSRDVVNNQELSESEQFVAFSPDGLSFATIRQRGKQKALAINGSEGRVYDEIFPNTVTFGSDGRQVNYIAIDRDRILRVWQDGNTTE